ncbi:hypothetical protein HMPREF1207_03712, partial [Paenibacillus sp. HGH0039]
GTVGTDVGMFGVGTVGTDVGMFGVGIVNDLSEL